MARVDTQTFYCKDSRGDEVNFGAPGGDFGEFLLAASLCTSTESNNESANESNNESAIESANEPQIKKLIRTNTLLTEWINKKCSKHRPFYLHTDEAALKRIFAHLNWTHSISHLKSCTEAQQEAFLDALCRGPANFHGCGHLRLIREQETQYKISKALMNELLREFFKLYWSQDERVLLKIYSCDLEGKGLAIVRGPSDLKESLLGKQKLASGQQCFILNQHACTLYRRDHLVPFFVARGRGSEKDVLAAMEEKGWSNAMMSANNLAPGKPVYEIEIKPAE